MLYLRRDQAPVSPGAWEQIDQEATRVLTFNLAGRRLVEFTGPLGWEHSAVNLGVTEPLRQAPKEGVSAGIRRLQPLMELRADFSLSMAELQKLDRGAEDPDLEPLIQAGLKMAYAEDAVVFNGYAPAGVQGILEASPHEPLPISEDYTRYPVTVAQAIETLRSTGVGGPYAIALGPRCYAGLVQGTNQGGYPLMDSLRNVVDGPIVRAPQVDGAVVMSQRGGDFEMVVGQDFSIGYAHHDGEAVHLFLIESFTFRVLAPEAAVGLRYS